MNERAYVVANPGRPDVRVPDTFKSPRADQLQGYKLERLTEVACRICYDSMGLKKSRNSEDLHKHIQEAPNLSVYEHAYLTVNITIPELLPYVTSCINRRGVLIRHVVREIRVTANLRAVLEWDQVTKEIPSWDSEDIGEEIRDILISAFKQAMPLALKDTKEPITYNRWRTAHWDDLYPDEYHISVYLRGSRGFSHEFVRHREQMSQRSTRFVDEVPHMPSDKPKLVEAEKCEGEYLWHPGILEYLADETESIAHRTLVEQCLISSRQADRQTYLVLVNALQAFNLKKGMDEISARKQARGAARGSLGNALATELIFTASAARWKHIFRQRASLLADDEIRETCITLWKDMVDKTKFGSFYKFELESKNGKEYLQLRE